MQRYQWDEISGELAEIVTHPSPDYGGWRHVGTKGSVDFYQDERGHVALETMAISPIFAKIAFCSACPMTRDYFHLKIGYR